MDTEAKRWICKALTAKEVKSLEAASFFEPGFGCILEDSCNSLYLLTSCESHSDSYPVVTVTGLNCNSDIGCGCYGVFLLPRTIEQGSCIYFANSCGPAGYISRIRRIKVLGRD